MLGATISKRQVRRVQFTNQAGETPTALVQTFAVSVRARAGFERKLSWDDDATPRLGTAALRDDESAT